MTAALVGGVATAALIWFYLAVRQTVPSGIIATPLVVYVLSEIRLTWLAPLQSLMEGGLSPVDAIWPMLSVTVLIISYLLYADKIGPAPIRMTRYITAPVSMPYDQRTYLRVILVLTGVLLLIGTLLYRGPPPVLDALRGLVDTSQAEALFTDLAATRKIVTKGHLDGGVYRGQGVLRALTLIGWPFLALMALAVSSHVSRRESRRWWWVLTTGLILTGVVYAGGAGVRSPIIVLVLTVGFGANLLWRARPRHLALALGLAMMLLFLIAPLAQSGGALSGSDRVAAIGTRVFVGNGINNVYVVQYLEDGRLSPGAGRLHLEMLRAAVPGGGQNDSFGQRLNRLRGVQVSRLAQASPSNFGRLFYDFGHAGTLLAYALMGVLIAHGTHLIFRGRKDVVEVAFNAIYVAIFLDLAGSAITGFIVQAALLVGFRALVVALLERRVPVPEFLRSRHGTDVSFSTLRRSDLVGSGP